MDWGQVIAGAIGGGASGLVSYADEAQKERSREDLASLKGQMQMDRLMQSIEGKYQQAIAVQEARTQAALDKAAASGGGRSSRAPALHEMTPEMAAQVDELYGVRRKATDRSGFETTTKQADPLSRMSPEEEAAAIESGGDVGDAMSRKTGGMVSTAFDAKGYAKAEDERTKRNAWINTILTNPSAIDNLSKAETQDIINTVTTYALKNPKADVGELLDRLNLLKPGDKRMTMGKDGSIYNEATGKVAKEGDEGGGNLITEMIKSVDAQRKALASEASDIKAAKQAELKDALPSERSTILQKYDPQLREIETKRQRLDSLFEQINARVGLANPNAAAKPATTTQMPTSAAPNVRSVIDAFKSRQTQR